MDQVKIGKLIAKLRKEKGLTQQQLGEKVNVGDRAVSKWERGISLPDIAIINELSEILGITSDELLKGELNKVDSEIPNKKFNYKLLLLLIPILIIIFIAVIYINNKADGDVYILQTMDQKYYVDGKLTITDNELLIFINRITFENYSFNQTIVKNYEYMLLSSNKIICKRGNIKLDNLLFSPLIVRDFLKTFTVDYKSEKPDNIDEILNNNLILKFIFVDENNNRIEKEIKIKIVHKKWL